ncbi:hypothetical protein [Dyadobacter arcticus]|uniref:Lipoprotein n=1 Tax=Dyadobacter arcticus TaxID=1078754 RepID=A0ABX0UN36_9BACT|nr:hypothetical protein [Dyadobacter arcticus]NIJ54408.1 hypothetical protein [Dyadobacter arcticus]
MKFRGGGFISYALILCIFPLINGCGGNMEGDIQCDVLVTEIDIAKEKYFADKNAGNCQKVVEAYDKYIKNDCEDKGSYVNSRDSFKDDNCK